MSLFRRPHVCACQDYVDMEVSLEQLRLLSSYDALCQSVCDELQEVYATSTCFQSLLYSTAAQPSNFASELSNKVFESLKNYDDGRSLASVLASECDTASQELAEMEARVDPSVRLPKKEREELAECRERVRSLKKQSAAKLYEVECLEKRLVNVFQMHAIRVQLQ